MTGLTAQRMARIAGVVGLLGATHGVVSLVMYPAGQLGLWGIPEAAWAGSAVASGLVAICVGLILGRR